LTEAWGLAVALGLTEPAVIAGPLESGGAGDDPPGRRTGRAGPTRRSGLSYR
jgi:hypothetical protein